MRVTQFTQYNNFILNQQRTLNELNNVQTQISTGVKIQNMYEDPVVYTKYLKLNEEMNSFTQIKTSASFAQTFANETDTVLNDFVSTLGSFKTNLLKAANDTNDETSRNAIVSELEGELQHLKDLANTSIDGKYLFSGSKFSTKPIDDNYNYQGNDDKVKAFLGAGVEREYNIDGASLFLGRDNDYSKHISTNVVQYDKMKANPQFVVRGADGNLYIDKHQQLNKTHPDEDTISKQIVVDGGSQIRMLTGVEDLLISKESEVTNKSYKFNGDLNDTLYNLLGDEGVYNNNGTYEELSFDFLKVEDESGNITTINVDSSTTLEDVKDKIENDLGYQVTYEDGKLIATDSNGNDVELTFTAYNDTNNDNVLVDSDDTKIGVFSNGENIYQDGVSYFYIKGKKANGDLINEKISLKNSDSVNDLLEKIGEIYGNTPTSKVVDVTLNDMGEIQIKDIQTGKMVTDFYMVASDKDEPSIEDLVKNGDYIVEFQKSNFNSIRNLSTIQSNHDYFDNRITKFGSEFKTIDTKREALPSDKLYNILGEEGIRDSDGTIQKLDHLTLSGVNTDGFEVAPFDLSVDENTTMQDLMDQIKDHFGDVSVSLENGELIINDNSISNPTDTSNLKIKIDAYDANDEPLQVFASKDVANFQKLYMDKNGNEINSNVSQIINDYKITFKNGEKIVEKNPLAQTYATEDTVIADTMGTDEMPQDIKLNFRDQNGELKTAVITLRDTPYTDANGKEHYSTFWIDTNNNGVREDNEIYDIYEPDGSPTPAHDKITTVTKTDPNTCSVCQKDVLQKGMTYRQLGDVVSMLTSGNLPASNSPEDYNNAVNASKKEVSSGMDDKGRFYLKDNAKNPTDIDLSMYTENNSLYFQANNAVTIDEPQVDFFDTLQKAIDAVKNGNNYPDSEKNPRNFGIQGAIEAIDHLTDHVRRSHAKIGAVSNEFGLTIERTDMLTLNVQQLQSDNIDTDLGEATMRLNSLQTSYQALLASIAKVNNLTLLNYL